MTTGKILEDRKKDYGSFSELATMERAMKKAIAHKVPMIEEDYKVTALGMIIHKIARIVNGNSSKIDTWQDIAGYAELVVNELKKVENVSNTKAY